MMFTISLSQLLRVLILVFLTCLLLAGLVCRKSFTASFLNDTLIFIRDYELSMVLFVSF